MSGKAAVRCSHTCVRERLTDSCCPSTKAARFRDMLLALPSSSLPLPLPLTSAPGTLAAAAGLAPFPAARSARSAWERSNLCSPACANISTPACWNR